MPATARWAGPMAPAPARRWPNSSAASTPPSTSASPLPPHRPPPPPPRRRRGGAALTKPVAQRPALAYNAAAVRHRPPARPTDCAAASIAHSEVPHPSPGRWRGRPATALGRAGADNGGISARTPSWFGARQRTNAGGVFVNRSCSHPVLAQPPSFSPREFRDALGMFATGVTIVTARNAAGKLVGLTA